MRTVFAQPDGTHLRRQLVEVADMLRSQFPDVAGMLTGAALEAMLAAAVECSRSPATLGA